MTLATSHPRAQCIVCLALFCGCTTQTQNAKPTDHSWNLRNAEIYRYLVADLGEPTPGRIWFITTTPMVDWGETGDWSTIPENEVSGIPNAPLYRPANEAYLSGGRVLEKGTDAEAWMQWISVKRWVSDSVVEIERGVWCCPLGGGARTITYENTDGKWRVKDYGESWMS